MTDIKTVDFFIGDIHVESNIDYQDLFRDKNRWFLQTFFKEELKQIKNNVLEWRLQKINISLLGDIIISDHDNMFFYYLEKEENKLNKTEKERILNKTINKYTDYLVQYNKLFIKNIEDLINEKLNNIVVNYYIILWNHDYLIPWNISSMWENIIIKTNENLPNNIRYKFIENKFIEDYSNNRLIYGDLNYPIYINMSSYYNVDKTKDYEYNTFLLNKIISDTKIIKNVIDYYFFNELSKSIEQKLIKLKEINTKNIYQEIQENLFNHISKEFKSFILIKNINKNNLIEWMLYFIKETILKRNINLDKYPYLKIFIKNIEYINNILLNNYHNLEIWQQIDSFVIILFTIIKNLFNIVQFLSYKKETSIFEDNDIKDKHKKNSFYYLSHFPFNLDNIKTIVWKNNIKCKKSSNYTEYEKKWLYFYFNKSWEYFLLLLELIDIIGEINNLDIKNIYIYSWHTHNNIECKFSYSKYSIIYDIYSFWYNYENHYIKKL